jgi:general secretion pathway protein L
MARLAGIDIGATVVRVALLKTSYRRVAVEAIAEAPIGEGGEQEAIAQAMLGMKPDAVAAALPGDRCFYRRLELPATAQRELEGVLAFELESTVPFEIDACVFDHKILKAKGPEGQLAVFAALAKTEDVEARIALVKRAVARDAEVIDTGAVPLANLTTILPELEGTPPPKPKKAPAPEVPEAPSPFDPARTGPVALLDLDETRSEILILVQGEPVFARTLSLGTRGLPASAKVLGRELSTTFGAWRAQGGDKVGALFLVGLGSTVQGAEPFLSATLGIPVQRLPMPALEGVGPDMVERLPLFAKAMSLALSLEGRARSLNLRQGPLATARSYAFLREKLPLLSGLAAVIAVSFGFSVVAEMRALAAEHDALTTQLLATTKEVLGEEIADLAKAKELLDKGPGSGDDDPLPTVDAFDVMVEYSKAVPKEVVHDVMEFDLQRGHATISALIPKDADAAATTDKIVNAMKQNPCFRDVKVQKTVQFGQDKQKYVLELDVRCEEKKDASKDKKKKDGDAKDSGKPDAKEGGK